MTNRGLYTVALALICIAGIGASAAVIALEKQSVGLIALTGVAIGAFATLAHAVLNDRPKRVIWPDDAVPRVYREEAETLEIRPFDREVDGGDTGQEGLDTPPGAKP